MNSRPDLDAAYRATAYTAHTPQGIVTLRIGEVNALVDQLLGSARAATWAYITAYNPGSVRKTAAENNARQEELRGVLSAAGYVFFEGAGIGEGWPPEPSFLILGISEAEACELGCRFGQLAIVVGDRGSPARLHWLH
jgi:hypothetical protein